MEGSYNVHLIYYDENIELNSENFLYMKQFKDKIKGIYFPVNNINSLINLVNKLKNTNKGEIYFSNLRKSRKNHSNIFTIYKFNNYFLLLYR